MGPPPEDAFKRTVLNYNFKKRLVPLPNHDSGLIADHISMMLDLPLDNIDNYLQQSLSLENFLNDSQLVEYLHDRLEAVRQESKSAKGTEALTSLDLKALMSKTPFFKS